MIADIRLMPMCSAAAGAFGSCGVAVWQTGAVLLMMGAAILVGLVVSAMFVAGRPLARSGARSGSNRSGFGFTQRR